MEDNTEEVRVNLPGLLRSLFFQEASVEYIFSMIKKKSLLFGPPLMMGKPR